MKPYVYIPYPKCLYKGTKEQHDTLTVQNEAEHWEAAKEGWITGGELHGYPGASPAFPELMEQMAADAKAAEDAKIKAEADAAAAAEAEAKAKSDANAEESRKGRGKAKA